MAYTPPRPTPAWKAWQSAQLQGLLGKGRGQGLFGQNLPSDGIPMGGRMNLISGGGPDPAALAGSRAFMSRIGSPNYPNDLQAQQPRTFKTGGLKVADLFKGAKLGQLGAQVGQPATPSPLAGYGQFGPQAAQTQAVQADQGVQGSTNLLQSATDLANAQAQRPTGEEGPEGIPAVAQGFFSRMVGEKGSGKRSDIGRSMMQAGARMMKGSTEGTFATIGEGLETGLEAYDEAKEIRAWEKDREIKAEDRATTLENRDIAEAAVEAMIESMPEDATVEIAAMRGFFAEGNAEAALKMGDVLLGRINYTDAIDDLGGKYLTSDKLTAIKAMPPEMGFSAMYEALDDAPAIEARAQALVTERGWTMADAMKTAVDPEATDRILGSPVGGGRTIVSSHGESFLIDLLTGEQIGDSIGESDMPLRWAQLGALEKEAEQFGLSDLLGSVTGYYDTLLPKVNAMQGAAEGLEILLSGEIEQSRFNVARKAIGTLFDTEESVQLASLENILKTIGIGNLSMFVGAISERELAEALALAGNINDMHATLADILARNMEGTIQGARQHNVRVERLLTEGVSLADEWDFNEAELKAFQDVAQVARAAGGQSTLERTPEFERLRQLRYGDGSGGLLEAGSAGRGDQTMPVGDVTADAPTAGIPRRVNPKTGTPVETEEEHRNRQFRALLATAQKGWGEEG